MASPKNVSLPAVLFPNQQGTIPKLKHANGEVTPAIESNKPVLYYPPVEETTKIAPDKAPQIIEAYYENKDGSPIPENKVQIGDEVNWVVKTKNAIGKSITVDFASNTKDFEYNGVPISGDVLRGLVIVSDVQKLPLKIINPLGRR